MQKKKGISLIVLVITIIVMIILAAAVIISMNNTGIIDKASHAVSLTDEKQVQDLASLLWAEAYLDEDRTDTIENVVKEGLAENKITDADWDIDVSDTGVTVSKKTDATNTNLIKFNIYDDEFQAEAGMTWGAWVASSYNTASWKVHTNNSIIDDAENCITIRYTADEVKSTDKIIANQDYGTVPD